MRKFVAIQHTLGPNVVSMCVVLVKIKHGTSKVLEPYTMLDRCNQGTFIDK